MSIKGPSVEVDGVRCNLHYFTGTVLSTRKEKETRVSSQSVGTANNPQVHVTSTTVNHHELFLKDADGEEQSFQLVDLDFPCREGNLVTIVWAIPENKERGPFVHVRNHNTNEYYQIGNTDIAYLFKKPWWLVWGSSIGISLVTIPVLGPLFMFGILPPIFYWRWRTRKAAKTLLASGELMSLDSQLAQTKPLAA